MADAKTTRKLQIRIGLIGVIVIGVVHHCTKTPDAADPASPAASLPAPSSSAVLPTGLSAPIAAGWSHDGEVVVAGLDVAAGGIRVQRIDANDKVLADRVVLDGVKWTTDSDLRVSAAAEGVAVTWRGLRGGKLVRQLVGLGPDLGKRAEPLDVGAATCTTREAVWFSDGKRVVAQPWSGASSTTDLPSEKDASLLCSPHRAFAIIEEEDKSSVLPLGPDAGASVVVINENDFGEDDQRELSEYTVGDEVGVVRLAVSGALAIRETTGTLHKLKTAIPKDDDVVAVDASGKIVVIVYTQDVSSTCPPSSAAPGDATVSTKVTVLRVDRQTFDESILELSSGHCGHEVGPFFTGMLGDNVSVAWAERTGGEGRARAPIVGLSHATVAPTSMPKLVRMAETADALVDAGCDGTKCWAAALVRRDGADAMMPGYAKILRWD